MLGDPNLRFRDSLNLCPRGTEEPEPSRALPPPPPPPLATRRPAEAPSAPAAVPEEPEAPEPEEPAEEPEEPEAPEEPEPPVAALDASLPRVLESPRPSESPPRPSESPPRPSCSSPRPSERARIRDALSSDAPPTYAAVVEEEELMARRRPGDDGLATSSAAIGHGVLQAQALRSFEAQRRGVEADEALARQLQASLDVSAAARQISQSDFVLQEATLKGRSDSWIARELSDSASLAATTAEILRPSTAQRAKSDEGLDVQRKRLRDRLKDFGLREHEVAGDGNCQFRALAHQLAADVERHGEVRARVARQLALERERYEDFCVIDEASVDADFDGFVRRMAKDAEWGDNVTLQAAADAYGVYVCLVTSYESRGILRVEPKAPPAHARTIWVAFWAEVHYSSIMPA